MTQHLVAVWNPTYGDDPLNQHLRILLHWSQQYRRGECDLDDVYVWWGKVRSMNRTQELPHAADVNAIQQQIDRQVETHVYLTDYRSLYVGNLDEIRDDDVMRDEPEERAHMPDYYTDQRFDFFFGLTDVRRIVSDDTPAVIEELRRLQNTRYSNRPVSIYGGMTDLPLIVTRPDEVSWFDQSYDVTGGKLWVEQEADLRGETERMGRELRENLFGNVIWSVLEPSTKAFLASAEAVYRSRRDDPSFDFSGPAIGYAKAVESDLNGLLFQDTRRAAAQVPVAERIIQTGGQPYDLGGRIAHIPLGGIRTLVEKDAVLRKLLRLEYSDQDWKWLLMELPAHLAPIVDVRNPAAHSHAIRRDEVDDIRNAVLGIGCEGLIVQLARIRLRART